MTVVFAIKDHGLFNDKSFERISIDLKNLYLRPHRFSLVSFNEEIYNWLIENVGEEQTTFRLLERISFTPTHGDIIQEVNCAPREKRAALINKLNPTIEDRRSTWALYANPNYSYTHYEVSFKSAESATLFKLTWL